RGRRGVVRRDRNAGRPAVIRHIVVQVRVGVDRVVAYRQVGDGPGEARPLRQQDGLGRRPANGRGLGRVLVHYARRDQGALVRGRRGQGLAVNGGDVDGDGPGGSGPQLVVTAGGPDRGAQAQRQNA